MRGVLLVLVCVVLLPLLVVQAGIYTAWYYSRWEEEEQANLAEAWLTEATFDDFVGDIRRQEAAVGAALAGLSPHTAEQAKDFLLASAKAFPSIRLWHWIDPKGDVIASNQSNLTHLNVADRPYFQEVRNGKPWAISDVLTDRATGASAFVIAHRVEDQKGALLDIVSATVEVKRLPEQNMPKHRAKDGTVAVFDRQGTVVYCSSDTPFMRRNWFDVDPVLAAVLQEKAAHTGTGVLPVDDQLRMVARVPLKDMGWATGASRPVRLSMADVYTGLWIAAGLNLLVALASAGFAAWSGGGIIRQLRQLQSHAQAIGRGDLAHHTASGGVRELAELATAFNQMGVALGQARQQQEQANAVLEQRVRERTAELRATSLYARSLIEASLDPLVTISPDGKVTDVNEATEATTGVSRRQLVGSDFSDYFTEPEKAREGYQKVLSEGLVRDYPLTIHHVSGRTIDVLYNAVVYRNEAGELQGVFAAARDVTERNQVEEQLRLHREHLKELVAERTQELEAANKQLEKEVAERTQAEKLIHQTADQLARSNEELEQFAYVASHDLQEPLRVVTGYVQLLERKYKDHLDADADQFIHYIIDGVIRMQQLITDLLNYSRVGSQGKPFQSTNVRAVLDRVLVNLQKVIEESGAAVTCDALPTVLGDEMQLIQLFQNLIGNGLKFRGGQPPRIHVSARREGDCWTFAVRDNGIGIERQYWDQIFVIFQRLHTRHKYAGTGIGLAICKRIVERHGGRIWLESQPGEGTTFHFTLR